MDEVMIFDSILSAEQITALYNSGTPSNTTIFSEGTVKGEVYKVAVTPNDGIVDATTKYAEVTIQNTAPTCVDGSVSMNEDSTFNFTTAHFSMSDINSDSLQVKVVSLEK